MSGLVVMGIETEFVAECDTVGASRRVCTTSGD